ncbi:hypothetical protein Goklo_003421 [Gossypium klotzschianum]|uniref:Uncharacterized protein n=1 Tax=Gossypium klotzschianum TaxID=34286 RepID=A0A7J8VL40_9ROSI|nr:hypothetical protein [Gossypium klotzschianum]
MDDTQRMMQMGGFGFDPSKNGAFNYPNDGPTLPPAAPLVAIVLPQSLSLSAEKDGLDIVQHEWALPKFEHRAEAVLKKLVS